MGSTTLAELLEQAEREESVGKMKVLAVLESLPGIGKVEAREIMDGLEISESRRLQGLGRQQREALPVVIDLRRRLRQGSVSLREVLERAESDELLAKLRLEAFVKRSRLDKLEIPEGRRVRGLSPREREVLLKELR